MTRDLLQEVFMTIKRKIVHIDEERCNGCGQCVSACAEGAIELEGGKARLVAEKYCDGLSACLGECPMGAISMIERAADPFDEEAVERYLAGKKGAGEHAVEAHDGSVNPPSPDLAAPMSLPCGCPSTQLQMLAPANSGTADDGAGIRQATRLTHWPVQIRLVPPTAPFLRNADILVASDCTPVAYPNFHEELLKGKVVLMGCPKFDDTDEYIDRFTAVFSTADIRSITIAIMEVPCCSKMPRIVETALKRSGRKIPIETIVISPRGQIVQRTKLAA
jgi:NAD-dependent dihydropyrimidine dehydrogenase PreA subunit